MTYEPETEKLARRINNIFFGGDSFSNLFAKIYLIALAAILIGGIGIVIVTAHSH